MLLISRALIQKSSSVFSRTCFFQLIRLIDKEIPTDLGANQTTQGGEWKEMEAQGRIWGATTWRPRWILMHPPMVVLDLFGSVRPDRREGQSSKGRIASFFVSPRFASLRFRFASPRLVFVFVFVLPRFVFALPRFASSRFVFVFYEFITPPEQIIEFNKTLLWNVL